LGLYSQSCKGIQISSSSIWNL